MVMGYNILAAAIMLIVGFWIVDAIILNIIDKNGNNKTKSMIAALIISLSTLALLSVLTLKNEPIVNDIKYTPTVGSLDELKVPTIVIIGDDSDEVVINLKKSLNDIPGYTLLIQNPLDETGDELIKEYNISTLPTLLISKDGITYQLNNQEKINEALKQKDRLINNKNIKVLIAETIKEL